MDTPTNVLSICSGIGGLDHGLRLACPTARPVVCVEGEAFAVACLVAQMRRGELAEAPIWTDLATFDGRPWRGVVDTVVGGFPCQPASVAGRRRGTDDERWLWDHVERVIGEVRPRWVYLENVPGLLSAPGPGMGEPGTGGSVRGGAMGAVLRGLATLGFDAEWCSLPASAVGSPQGRMRWFLLGNAHGAGPQGRLGTIGGIPDERPAWPPGPQDDAVWELVLAAHPRLAPALPTEPAICRVAPGRPVVVDNAGRVDRLRALGNCVVPQQAALAFRILWQRLMEVQS